MFAHCNAQRAQGHTLHQCAVGSCHARPLWQLTPDLERPAATSPYVETEQVCSRGVELRKQGHSPAASPHDRLDLPVELVEVEPTVLYIARHRKARVLARGPG